MNIVLPSPPVCPRCAGQSYIREGFFRIVPRQAGAEEAILGRCGRCGLRRFMAASGEAPHLRARPRWVPARLLRRLRAAGPHTLLLAPAGTDTFSVGSVTRWSEGLPNGPLDLLWLWHSLEERADVAEALAQARPCLKPGGMLRVTAVNASALSLRLSADGFGHLEPQRQRVLFSPRLLADFLKDAGFRRGRLSFSLIFPEMRAEAFAPE